MKYISTRGAAPSLGFCDVLLTGLAPDGGLYVPERWPSLSAGTIAGFAGKPFAAVAAEVMAPFIGDELPAPALRTILDDAYGRFGHPAVAPLVQVAPNHYLLELFHGPTLAFKDVAMQALARLMDHVLDARDMRATVVGATSGDTGGAAIEAFRGMSRTDMVILFPKGRVSDVQRRQMTTAEGANIHALSIEGTFDDCQTIVKAMFTHKTFRDAVGLSGINSINWARILAQVVYYFTAAVSLGAPHRPVSFTVPTGNFGDIFAGYVAKRMGLPIERLVIATNVNDILARTLATGTYALADVVPTTSPSMDIQISSNFERLMFDAMGRDADGVARMFAALRQSGTFTLDDGALAAIRAEFAAGRSDEAAVAATIASIGEETGVLIDPHTAVGVGVAETLRGEERGDASVPMVTLATAHPAKFPDAVKAASGVWPALPARLSGLMDAPERATVLPADQGAVERFILENVANAGVVA